MTANTEEISPAEHRDSASPDAKKLLAQAGAAAKQGNFNEALRLCAQLQHEWPDNPDGFSSAAAYLLRAHRPAEADALLEPVLGRFAEVPQIWVEHALVPTYQRDWTVAIMRWQSVRERFPNRPEGHSFAVLTLREAKRNDEAELVAVAALDIFPAEFRLFFEYGLVARQRGDLSEAVNRFTRLIKQFPKNSEGHAFAVLTLRDSKRFDEAEALASQGMTRFPEDFRIALEHGLLARQRADWPEAVRRFDRLRERFPDKSEGYTDGAAVLVKAGRGDEAVILLDLAALRFPLLDRVAIERAWTAITLKNWEAALAHSQVIRDRFPNQPHGYFIAVMALLRLGQFEDAENMAGLGRERLPQDLDIMVWSAKTATHRRDWPTAMERWDLAMRTAPDSPMVSDGIALARQAMEFDKADQAGSGKATAPLALRDHADVIDESKFLLRFESLGDNCEFGLVQRFDGLEPLGLLRWATTYANHLTTMLETRFDGVGELDNTVVDLGSGGEWHARDKRYFGMHTFIYDPKLDPLLLARQMARRFKFLRDKLIEDLEMHEKIFVYKQSKGIVPDAQLEGLRKAILAYGPNILLYVRHSERPDQEDTVVKVADGLLIGYLSDLTTDPQAVRGYSAKWKALCRLAWPLAKA